MSKVTGVQCNEGGRYLVCNIEIQSEATGGNGPRFISLFSVCVVFACDACSFNHETDCVKSA